MAYKIDPRIPHFKRLLKLEFHRLHFHVPKGFRVNAPYCGKIAQGMLREYQRAVHIPVTGRLDNTTCYKLSHPPAPPTPKMTKREHALHIALSQVGVQEEPLGSNRGPMVDRYIMAGEGVKQAFSEPWCGDFVTWCSQGAGIKLPSFYYPRAFEWFYAGKRGAGGFKLVSLDNAQPGDIVVWNWGHVSRYISQSTGPNGRMVKSVDGNCSDKVGIWERPADLLLGVVRTPE